MSLLTNVCWQLISWNLIGQGRKVFFLSKIFRLKFISRESSKNALELENFADEIALLLLLFLNPTKFPTYSRQNSATRSSQTEHVLHPMASCIVFLLKERGLVSCHISDTLVVSWHILYDTYSSLVSPTDPVTQIKAGLSIQLARQTLGTCSGYLSEEPINYFNSYLLVFKIYYLFGSYLLRLARLGHNLKLTAGYSLVADQMQTTTDYNRLILATKDY